MCLALICGWKFATPLIQTPPVAKPRWKRYHSIEDVEIELFDWTDSVVANLEAFGAAIRTEKPYPYSEFELLHNIEVLDAIILSAETGEAFHLNASP